MALFFPLKWTPRVKRAIRKVAFAHTFLLLLQVRGNPWPILQDKGKFVRAPHFVVDLLPSQKVTLVLDSPSYYTKTKDDRACCQPPQHCLEKNSSGS